MVETLDFSNRLFDPTESIVWNIDDIRTQTQFILNKIVGVHGR